MKFSFMSFSTPELTLEEMLSIAEDLGYQGIEPRIDAGHSHGVETDTGESDREQIRGIVENTGVELACVATSCRFADPQERDRMIERAHQAIDLTGDFGAARMRVFGGRFPERMSRGEAVEGLSSALRGIADHAGERGISVCVETHDAADVLQRVSHAAIGANWDIMHPVRTGDATIEESFWTLRPWIRHLHVHDGVSPGGGLKLTPIGEGHVDHRRVIELLDTIDYEGFLSGEWIGWEPYEDHLPREIATLKKYVAQVP